MNGKRVIVVGESKHNEKGDHLIINNDRGGWYGATQIKSGYATLVEKMRLDWQLLTILGIMVLAKSLKAKRIKRLRN